MTPQDYEDITILKHAAQDILRYINQLLEDTPPYDDLECVEIVDKCKQLARIGELISEILENGKHLPSTNEEVDEE